MAEQWYYKLLGNEVGPVMFKALVGMAWVGGFEQ